MIFGEVRENAGLKRNFVRPVQNQRVGRYLHHAVCAARVHHLGEKLLQLKGLRRGALGVDDGISDHVLNRADEAHLRAERLFQHCFEKVRDRRLPVRSGHAEHRHFIRRMAEPVCAKPGKCLSAIGNLYILCLLLRLALADDHTRAALKRLGDEPVAVGGKTGDGDKGLAGLCLPRVVAHARHLQLRVVAALYNLDSAQKFRKLHAPRSFRFLFLGVLSRRLRR